MENAVAETAFFVPLDEGFEIRWFTPEIEMDLCGHATLAAAHVIARHLNYPLPCADIPLAEWHPDSNGSR
jgi:PhzF family phenazine biosynthesis protein